METTAYSLPELMTKAEHYTAAAEHCVYDVQLKLRQWGCTSADEQTIIAHLQQEHFIDQQRYARAFVHDKLLYQGWGRNKLRAGLYAKHIDEATIDAALGTIHEDDYRSVLRKAAAQKKGATREQLLRFLYQRGFTYDEIQPFL